MAEILAKIGGMEFSMIPYSRLNDKIKQFYFMNTLCLNVQVCVEDKLYCRVTMKVML